MTSWADQLHRRSRIGSVALWGSAALAVVALYAGGLSWVLREPPPTPAASAPPPAIMIDLAPAPEAVDTEETQLAPDDTETQEIRSDTVEPVEQPMPDVTPAPEEPVKAAEPGPQPEPTPDDTAETPPDTPEKKEPVEQKTVNQEQTVEVPIPMPRPPHRPKPPQKTPPEKKTEPARHNPAPVSRRTNKASAPVRKSDRSAAQRSANGRQVSQAAVSRWQSRLVAHLERYKRYPSGARSRGETGTAYLRFRIDENGRVLSAAIVRSSGFPDLDAAVLDLVHRASPVPVPPPGANLTITAPVRFSVR